MDQAPTRDPSRFDRLPTTYRHIFMLLEAGRSHAEIAAELGIEEAAVRSLVRIGTEKLRVLERDAPPEERPTRDRHHRVQSFAGNPLMRPLMRRLLVVLLVTSFAAAACSSQPDSASPPATGPASIALGEGEFALPAEPRWPSGSWAGKVEGTDAFIAVVAGKDGFVAYVCDNERVGEWFRTDEPAGALVLAGDGGSALAATRKRDDVIGTVQFGDGSVHAFTASPAPEPIHRSEGFDEDTVAVAGWVTLPSGDRRGTLKLAARVPLAVKPKPVITTTTTKPVTTTAKPVTTTAKPVTTTAKPPPATTTTTAAPPPVSPPTITVAPVLKVGDPITVPKTVVIGAPTIELQPPNPLTPDSVSPPTANATKFVWSAIGDSYASGEGAPVRAGTFGRPFFNIENKTYWGDAVPDSGVTVAEREACHRSELAGPPLANERLKQSFPDVTIEFSHFACSGAETFDLMHPSPGENIVGYDGPDLNVKVEQPAQGHRAAEWAARKGQYDALYVGIGGNDIGFGDVISECLIAFQEGAECSDKPLKRSADARTGRGEITLNDAVARLPGTYRELDSYLRSSARPARPGTVLIAKAPDPSRGENGVMCGGNEGRMDGDILSLVSKKEMAWAIDEILEKGINDSVETTAVPVSQGGLGWTIVDGHLPLFTNHGICAQDNYVNTNNQSLEKQGDDYDATVGGLPLRPVLIGAAAALGAAAAASTGPAGLFLAPTVAVATALVAAGVVHLSSGLVHPNAKGFEQYATAITAKVEPLLAAKLAAGLRPPTRVRQAGAVNNGEMVVRWEDKSTSEDRYEVTVTSLEGSATVPSAPVRVDRNAQEVRIPVSGRLAARIDVRACVRDVCSDPGSVDAVNFVPAVPTNGTGAYTLSSVENLANSNRASANVGWTAAPFALKYVIAYRQVEPAGATTGQFTTNTPFGGVAIKEPPHTTTGNDKALYAFKIAACSWAGCSVFSPEVLLDTRGAPPAVSVISPRSGVPIGIQRPELVVDVGNLPVPNPLPLPTRDDLSGGGGGSNSTIPNPGG